MSTQRLLERYREMQTYVGWTAADERLVAAIGPLVAGHLPSLIDDFYEEIERHPAARKVITGGQAQIERLKGTLLRWVQELLTGKYDLDYVARRWRVGWRHVEIGLDQVYTNLALSRLRGGLVRAIHKAWTGPAEELLCTIRAVNKLLDLDLAIIEDAYQAEYATRLQRSERLATLGQVAGGVAHELRNPLNVVKTSVYYLLNARDPTPEKKVEHLKRIERQVDLADAVITALSNFARMPLPDSKPVALLKLVEESLENNAPGDLVHLSLEIPASLPPVLADRDQLQLVFGNLIRNARDAMPDGGMLTITGASANRHVELAFKDTGVGISEEHLGRIMEPLFSTKVRGLGLGLAIARSILEKNQGSLSCSSKPGQGSTFTVRLLAAPVEEGLHR
jgi:two-component system, NtrC family, sensor kinase